MICRKTMQECQTQSMCAPYGGCGIEPDRHLQEVLDFLDSIEGDGYGGMASFEIARAHVRDMCGHQQERET